MVGGAAVIWLAVIGVAIYAMRVQPGSHPERRVRLLIGGGGIVFPTVVLLVLLVFGLRAMPPLLAPGEGLRIHVEGLQWWWRVRYVTTDGREVVSANEIRLPAGERVEFILTSADVIHSFWIPSLGGKMDMIPGRTNRLALEPTRTGTFRGVCAEYCGGAHAWMAFPVAVLPAGEFDRWLSAEMTPARAPQTATARRGSELFLDNGCGACHTIRGTPANGEVGPDLTHVGSRLALAAGTLPLTTEALAHWTANTTRIKPQALMPAYDMLADDELNAIATYLEGLK